MKSASLSTLECWRMYAKRRISRQLGKCLLYPSERQRLTMWCVCHAQRWLPFVVVRCVDIRPSPRPRLNPLTARPSCTRFRDGLPHVLLMSTQPCSNLYVLHVFALPETSVSS